MHSCDTCAASPAAMPFTTGPTSGKTLEVDQLATIRRAERQRQELVHLLGAVGEGDRNAFANLYSRTSGKLYGICLRLLSSEAEAEDALQEAFVAVWRNARRFEPGRASPITWLGVIARNKALDRLRQRQIGTDGLEAANDVADDSASAVELIEQEEDTSRLARCLGELEERPRAMIRSAFIDGLTYSQLADREGVPLGTMKSWIRRALINLRGCLQR